MSRDYRTPTALLSRDYSKMIECFSIILQCTTAIILWATAYYIYSLIKMATKIINDLLLEVPYDPPKSKVKRQKFIKCILTGNNKQYLRKAYTKEQVNKLSAEEVDKLFSICEAKLSGQMVKSLGKSIIKMYSKGACAVLPRLCSPKVHLPTLLQIWFVISSFKCWVNYWQKLLIRTWY